MESTSEREVEEDLSLEVDVYDALSSSTSTGKNSPSSTSNSHFRRQSARFLERVRREALEKENCSAPVINTTPAAKKSRSRAASKTSSKTPRSRSSTPAMNKDKDVASTNVSAPLSVGALGTTKTIYKNPSVDMSRQRTIDGFFSKAASGQRIVDTMFHRPEPIVLVDAHDEIEDSVQEASTSINNIFGLKRKHDDISSLPTSPPATSELAFPSSPQLTPVPVPTNTVNNNTVASIKRCLADQLRACQEQEQREFLTEFNHDDIASPFTNSISSKIVLPSSPLNATMRALAVRSSPTRAMQLTDSPKILQLPMDAMEDVLVNKKLLAAVPSPEETNNLSNEVKDLGIVKIKNKRVVFNEKKLNLVMHPLTINELSKFHLYRAEQESVLPVKIVIPECHYPLISKLVVESELDENRLIQKLVDILYPSIEHVDLAHQAIKVAIAAVAVRVNYGMDVLWQPSAAMTYWRWEVTNVQHLPPDVQSNILARRTSRQQAMFALRSYIASLSESERAQLVAPPKRAKKMKLTPDQGTSSNTMVVAAAVDSSSGSTASLPIEIAISSELGATETEEIGADVAHRKKKSGTEKTPKAKPRIVLPTATPSSGNILNFFSRVKKDETIQQEQPAFIICGFDEFFRPFHVKSNVIVAPINRFHDIPFDASEIEPIEKSDFIELITGPLKPVYTLQYPRTRVVGLEGDRIEYVVMKHLQFHSNYRPAFRGSWRKRSDVVNGRRPFGQDPTLDYELDSDDEWEEEDEGESIGSDASDEEEERAAAACSDSEDDDDWLVPHGYLSEDEGVSTDEEEAAADAEENKTRNKSGPKEYLKKPRIEDIPPLVIGPIFIESWNSIPDQFLDMVAVVLLPEMDHVPNPLRKTDNANVQRSDSNEKVPRKSATTRFPDNYVPGLLQLVHGNRDNVSKMFEDFVQKVGLVSRRQFERKLAEVAVKERRESIHPKACWYLRAPEVEIPILNEKSNTATPSDPIAMSLPPASSSENVMECD